MPAKPKATSTSPHFSWQPKAGEAVRDFLNLMIPDEAARNAVLKTSIDILGRGVPPTDNAGETTGLVVGYVQSGKTLSFESVIALARDNGFPIVIVITGTSNPLLKQTAEERLPHDLQIGQSEGPPQWIHLNEPGEERSQEIRKVLEKWRDSELHMVEKPTLLLTVKKQHQRLKNLQTLLSKFDLSELPTLIIDDEADQASLNTKASRNDEGASKTYVRLLALRKSIPHLTYLQYTATPQAVLLINIIDNLSPNFVVVLEPGTGYVGGREFFGENDAFAPEIPPEEIPTQHLDEPPESLLLAMRQFFIGVAAGLISPGWGKGNPNRSMFVHPSRETERHFEYFRAIEQVKEHWQTLMSLPASDEDRREFIAEIKKAFDDLTKTYADMPAFNDILAKLPRALKDTWVKEINTRGRRKTPSIDWQHGYPWILVGGQSMDRGFTIRGLTVTYMPRGLGTGNADTLQQRARFFGYKRKYLGLCRIHLEGNVLEQFCNYAEHEEDMRAELLTISRNQKPLKEWKRRFILAPELNPCRNNVLSNAIIRGNFANKWTLFPHEMLMTDAAIQNNKEIMDSFLTGKTFVLDSSFASDKPAQQHKVCSSIPLRELMNDFLTLYQVAGIVDSPKFVGLQLQLKAALDANVNETASVYVMRPEFRSQRTIKDSREMDHFLQGRTETVAGVTYPGDETFRSNDNVTLQIHLADLKDKKGNVIAMRVPLLAIRLPRRMSTNWIAQGQEAQH